MDFGLHDGWLWAIGGVVLLILEVLAPGFFLMFLGAAAIATGAFTLLFDLSLAPQLALFVIYTALALYFGKKYYGEPDDYAEGTMLNNPSSRMIGRSATVVSEIDDHGGRVKLGDSEWSARGGPAGPGDKVEITAIDGNCLVVGTPRVIAKKEEE